MAWFKLSAINIAPSFKQTVMASVRNFIPDLKVLTSSNKVYDVAMLRIKEKH